MVDNQFESEDFQAGGGNVALEFRDIIDVTSQYRFHNCNGLISASKPDNLGWVTVMSGQPRKIGILRHEHKTRILGVLPNDTVVRFVETEFPNRFGFGKQIGEQCAKLEAEILVEQQLHAAVRTPRSRSAA